MFSSFESKEEVKEATDRTNKALSAVTSAYDYIAEHEFFTEYSDRLYDIILELGDVLANLKEETRYFED